MAYEVYAGSPPTKIEYRGGYWVALTSLTGTGTDSPQDTVQRLNARPRPPKTFESYWDSHGNVVTHVSTPREVRDLLNSDITDTSRVFDIRRQNWVEIQPA